MTERQLPGYAGDMIFRLLGDPTIRQVCFELSISPLTFNELIELTGVSQSVVSRAVAKLREERVALPWSGRNKAIELFHPQLMREVFIASAELLLVLSSTENEETKKNLDRLGQASLTL